MLHLRSASHGFGAERKVFVRAYFGNVAVHTVKKVKNSSFVKGSKRDKLTEIT